MATRRIYKRRGSVVHKFRLFGKGITVCGSGRLVGMLARTTILWRDVTCKRCLATRKKEE